ncbi:phosphatidate cytidylyltransferase [Sulfuriflexus mobilis]|uniref:phosphatidate cytidylyltransferase n=1 Tax=Sulfuriflexus mobilis TaxID=1811807 RepID=UPI001558543D|nr:phosphatidate cytidylyltransferase [Sulfuriflexus mobilis]
MLKQRIITALLLLPIVVLTILYLPTPAFAMLWAVVLNLAVWEWSALARLRSLASRIIFLLVIDVALVALWFNIDLNVVTDTVIFLAAGFWACVVISLLFDITRRMSDLSSVTYRAVSVMTGVFIVIPAWLALVLLHTSQSSSVLLVFCLVWAADTGAYFAGRRFGKRKLAPSISPGKSWEGVAGGLLLSLIVVYIWSRMADMPEAEQLDFIVIAMIAVMVSIYGDLLESVFKRVSGIKDSGQLLPGHGGVMDRLDSITAAGPIFVAGYLIKDLLL